MEQTGGLTGLPAAGQALFTMDAWLIGCLLIAIRSAFVLRPLLRIC